MSESLAVDANQLGVHSNRGWVYQGFTLRAGAGQLVAVAGPGGTGRTSVLLTLGGRMRFAAGSLTVCGIPLPSGAALVRSRTAVARLGGSVADLDDELRVADHVTERALAAGVAVSAFDSACRVLDLSLDTGTLVGSLQRWQATALALALGLMEGRQLVLLDDLDAGEDGAGVCWLWGAARRAAASGPCVVATCAEGGYPAAVADQVIGLGR